ncbi:MAG TPA: DNA alkylation repair protein [Chryseolinea sp.]
MAEPLKYMYDVNFFERLYPVLKKVIPGFEERKFVYSVFDNEWPDLELKQRTRQVTRALNQCLPPEYPRAIEMIMSISGLLREREKAQSYPFIFLPEYIELYGLSHFSLSMKAIEESTKLVSAEFAIRPFIIKYPRETMRCMLGWSTHPDAAVRRLASEGCRPRLPWAVGLPDLKRDPSPILPILENLKTDPSEYVRRSVANNLNDIAKDHPEVALQIARNWKGISKETDWIIKHGCRTLLKRGNEAVLTLHGFDPKAKASVKEFNTPKKIRIGDRLDFDFTFFSRERSSALFRLEYAIDYQTSTGKISRKVFKLSESTFEPYEPVHIRRKQSFRDLTTRKHFRGKHYIRILANGKELAGSEFIVI